MVTLTAPINFQKQRLRPRIEILGVFGSGKTTLAHELAPNEDSLLLENHEQNIFWKIPDASAVSGFLSYELSFLIQHQYLAASALKSTATDIAICDWSFESDRLWASMRLNKKEYAVYNSTYRKLISRVNPPMIYLHLCFAPSTIYARQLERNRVGEKFNMKEITKAANLLEKVALTLPKSKVIRVREQTDLATIKSAIDCHLRERK